MVTNAGKAKIIQRQMCEQESKGPSYYETNHRLTVKLICRYTSEKSTDKITVAFLTPSGGLIMLL